MSANSYREKSRLNWVRRDGQELSLDELQLGAIQRIADATELMAKRHQELIDQKERAEKSRDYWMGQHDSMVRRLVAARGQITKLKKAAAREVSA